MIPRTRNRSIELAKLVPGFFTNLFLNPNHSKEKVPMQKINSLEYSSTFRTTDSVLFKVRTKIMIKETNQGCMSVPKSRVCNISKSLVAWNEIARIKKRPFCFYVERYCSFHGHCWPFGCPMQNCFAYS